MSQQTPSQQTPSQQTPSQQTPTPEPQPAQPPEDQRPGERDLEIYRAVRIHLHKQKTVALTYGLTPGRISQIVKRVSRHLARLFPGEDLKLRFAEAKRMRLMDFECHERRVEMYRQCGLALEQSEHALVDQQWTYEGPAEPNKLVKTVVKQRGQPISMAALREMRRLNNEMQWGGGKPPKDGEKERRRDGGKEGRRAGKATVIENLVIEKLPPPECLSEADRAEWPQLMREEQELALVRLKLYPGIPLRRASVPPGPLWSYFPWRTEAEHNASLQAARVVRGEMTIEEYLQRLEVLELSKPFAHPNLLTKDRSGQWQLLDPQQVPLPVMPAERAALPAESPERVYWPNKSKAAHFAMMRAEMVLRGHLSRDQYESLNAWASWYMNEKYPDPLAQCAEKFNSSETKAPTSGRGDLPPTSPTSAAGGDGNCTLTNKAPTRGRGDEPADVPGSSTLTTGQGFDCEASGVRKHPGDVAEPTEVVAPIVDEIVETRTHQETDASPSPTKLERLLASGRRLSPREQRRLEGLAARRRENCESTPTGTGSG